MTASRRTPKGANRTVREALKARRNRTVTFYLATGDPDEAAAAITEHETAMALLERSKLIGVASEALQAVRDEVEERLARATENLDNYRYRLRFKALSNVDYEHLINANPLPDPPYNDTDNPAPDNWYWPLWNDVLAACAIDSDLTAKDWAAELAAWPGADRNALLELLRNDLHAHPANAELPKG